jgi:drug/metabolite transporter (DMT)-like permease
LVAILALALETGRIEWTMPVVLSMVWLILVLSIGAVGLLMYLIRQGNSSSVASLFFLVPVVAMAMAWFLFGETLDSVQIAGSAIVIASVAMASRTK